MIGQISFMTLGEYIWDGLFSIICIHEIHFGGLQAYSNLVTFWRGHWRTSPVLPSLLNIGGTHALCIKSRYAQRKQTMVL